MADDAHLALAGVGCVRSRRALFAGIDLMLAAGDAAVVTGPNGVGKSSLIRIAAGLLRPAAGSARRHERTALLTEATALDGDRTLGAALVFWAQIDRAPDPAGRVAAALDALDLAPLAEVPVRLLSTGQRRRAAFARVVAAAATLWLLDEPASGLDAPAIARLEAAIARHRAAGGSVLVATHQPLALPRAATIALTPPLEVAA